MQDALGYDETPTDLTPATTPEPPRRRRRWLLVLLVLVLVAVAAVAGGMAWLGQKAEGSVDHPDAWDPRVREYAEAVEKHRGLDFEHPVHVDFLSVPAFQKKVTQDEADLTRQDREDLEHSTGLFRALGLLEGDVDLLETMNELQSVGIVGYYDDEDQRIRMRGTELTPNVRSTLVHELTHALQDQHFGIGKKLKQLEEDDAAMSAYRALVEGDATRVESRWRADLDKSDAAAVEKAEQGEFEKFEKDAAGLPGFLKAMLAAPYALGEPMIGIAANDGAVNALFENPPTTEEHLLDPWTLVDEDTADEVATPELGDGEKKYDDGPFGALGWLFVLAERIPAAEALEAADGWGGDSYVSFRRDGVDCVRVSYRGETSRDLAQLHAATTSWISKQPAGGASVERVGDQLHFESCDPGSTAEPVATGGSEKALELASARAYMGTELLGSGFPEEAAQCSADALVRNFTLKELNDPDLDQGRVERVMTPCM